MSNKDLKKLIYEYKDSESELLNFISNNRKIVRGSGIDLFEIQNRIERSINEENIESSKGEIIKNINEVMEKLKQASYKYDYDKLPRN